MTHLHELAGLIKDELGKDVMIIAHNDEGAEIGSTKNQEADLATLIYLIASMDEDGVQAEGVDMVIQKHEKQ